MSATLDQSSVNYRDASSFKACLFCVMYQIGGTCTLVKGDIRLLGTCDRFA